MLNKIPTPETELNNSMARLDLILAEARRLSAAATELKNIESMELNLTADELSDAWEHVYSELYRANEAFKAAITS